MQLHDAVLRDAYNAVKQSGSNLQNRVNELEAELEKFKVVYCYLLIINESDLCSVQGPTQFVLCLVDGDGKPLCD